MKNKLRIYSWLGILSLFFLLSACQQVRDYRTIKLGHGLDTQHPVHKGMVFMAEKVAEKSSGKLRIDIYPSQQLGTERQLLELLQIGSLGMTKVSAAVMESFAPTTKVLGLPYIFRSREHHYRVLDGQVGKDLLAGGSKYWLKGVCFFDAGSRSFYSTKKPIHQPSDLEGLKIRVQESPTALALVNGLGGSATPISWGELYTALQQGVVDGAENNPPSFYTSRHFEICKYYTLNEHTAVPDILVMSTHLWNDLNEQERAWLQAAVDEAVAYQRKIWQEFEQESLAAVQAAGVEIIRPDKQPFMDKISSMFDQYKDDKEVYDMIQRIQAVD